MTATAPLPRLAKLALFASCCLFPVLGAAANPTEVIVLENGTKLVGEVVGDQDGKVRFKDAVLGALTFPSAAIRSRQLAVAVKDEANPTKTAAAMAVVPAGAPGTPAASAATAPKVVWTRQLQLNFGYISGAAPSRGAGSVHNLNAMVGIERATAERIASFSGSFARSRSKPLPPAMQNANMIFQYDEIFSDRTRIISRTTGLIDMPNRIKHRVEEQLAYGYTFLKTPSTQLLIAPGLGYSTGRKELMDAVDQDHFGYGAYEHFTHAFNQTISFEQNFSIFRSFETRDYTLYSLTASLKAQLSAHLALVSQLNLKHDSLTAPGVEATQYQTTTGIQIKF